MLLLWLSQLNKRWTITAVPILSIPTAAAGSAQDYIIPSGALNNKIDFTLRGGDGGYAKAGNNCTSEGGDGATTTVTILINDGPTYLKPGGTIRFVVGKHSENGDVDGTNNTQVGGGTAVLYRPNNTAEWTLLAVAAEATSILLMLSAVARQQAVREEATRRTGM